MNKIIFASSIPKEAYKISKLLKEKKIRKIAPRIYSSNFNEEPSEIIKSNLLEVLSRIYPRAILSHRSAFEYRPTSTDQIFLTYTYTKKINLPGVTINFLKGKGPVDNDNKIINDLYASSKERALLENLQISKKTGPNSKTLSISQIEEKLDDVLRINGEVGLNRLRDKARELSEILDMQKEFKLLNKRIGALLTTKPSKILKSDIALSRALGIPYDKNRISLFESLFAFLHNKEFKDRPKKNISRSSFKNFAFMFW